MSAQLWPPFDAAMFHADPATSWFAKVRVLRGNDALHDRLKVEPVATAKIHDNDARQVIHGPATDGRWDFFTGMRAVGVPNWFEGNVCEHRGRKKVRSLLLVALLKGGGALVVTLFPGYYPRTRDARLRFAAAFALHAEQHGLPEIKEGGR